jgi:hypothetical protein
MKHARDDYNRIQDPAGLIPEDEPVFLLRGQDICAPIAVETWAKQAEQMGASPKIVQLAREQAARMRAWHTFKTPDL